MCFSVHSFVCKMFDDVTISECMSCIADGFVCMVFDSPIKTLPDGFVCMVFGNPIKHSLMDLCAWCLVIPSNTT